VLQVERDWLAHVPGLGIRGLRRRALQPGGPLPRRFGRGRNRRHAGQTNDGDEEARGGSSHLIRINPPRERMRSVMSRSFLVRVLPWLLVGVFGAATLFLLSRKAFPWGETRFAEAAPVVMAIRKIAQFSTVEVQVSDVVRYEEAKHFLVFDFPKSAT